MSSKKDRLSVLEVLDNLSAIVEARSLDEIELAEGGRLVTHPKEKGRAYWIQAGANEETVQAVRDTFRHALHHLEVFHDKIEEGAGDQKRLVDGINEIMVLAGEAASKLERLDHLFREKIPTLDEYRNLQSFYRQNLAKEEKEFAKIPLRLKKVTQLPSSEKEEWEEEYAALLEEEGVVEESAGIHLLNDISAIKRDHLYELFHMKNELEEPFYTSELTRHLKLACDFGTFAAQATESDPLVSVKIWEDRGLHTLAKHLLATCRKQIEKFCKQALRYKEVEFVSSTIKALLALFLAADPKNLLSRFAKKGSYLYFSNFQTFLRETLESREFQRYLLYRPPTATPFYADVLSLVLNFVYHLYFQGPGEKELRRAFHAMVATKGEPHIGTFSAYLRFVDDAIREVLNLHPGGPLFKAVDIVRDMDESPFDPYIMGNLPSPLFAFKSSDHEMSFMRFPCPTKQGSVDRAELIEEFKAFLYMLEEKKEHLLIINLQDRTSWKDHARTKTLEEISHIAEFAQFVTLVTMPKETEFYHQSGVYRELSLASDFMSQFYDHLSDESAGFVFPTTIKERLFPTFVEKLLAQVHEVFFEKKKSLTLRERLDFIELVYAFISLKLMELTSPTLLTMLTKDGLDGTATASVALYALLAIGQGGKWKREELDILALRLYGETLLYRERAVHKECIERLLDLITLLEGKKGYLAAFAPLFDKATLKFAPYASWKNNE